MISNCLVLTLITNANSSVNDLNNHTIWSNTAYWISGERGKWQIRANDLGNR